MIKHFLRIFLIGLLLFSTKTKAQNIDAYLSAKQYFKSDSTTLIDFYLSVGKKDLVAKNNILSVEGIVYLKDTVTEKLDFVDKFIMRWSPTQSNKFITKISSEVKFKNYELFVQLTDVNNPKNKTTKTFPYKVENYKEKPLSDLFFVGSLKPLTKVGFFEKSLQEIVPKNQGENTLFTEMDTAITIYFETYHWDTTKNIYLETYIQKLGDDFPVSSSYSLLKTHRLKHENIISFPLSTLKNGGYHFYCKILDNSRNVIQEKSMRFSRLGGDKTTFEEKSEKITKLYREKVIKEFKLREPKNIQTALIALLRGEFVKERQIMPALKTRSVSEKLDFYFEFWEDKHPDSPSKAIADFNKDLKYIKQNLGGIKTDKTRVFLLYGKPNDVEKENWSPDAQPYEIWHYHETKTGLQDKIFVFTNNNRTIEERLLHSDVEGELNQPFWKDIIKINPSSNFINRR
jgi:GWxTD domain-containing protein